MHTKRQLTEREILDDLANGNQTGFQWLITTYFPILCRFAEKFLPDSSLAKDVVQETFINFWNGRRSFHSLISVKAYLFTATKNGCLNLIRSRERMENRHLAVAVSKAQTEDPFVTEMVYLEKIALIYKVVLTLSPQMQEVFYLSYEKGMTVSEISAMLNMKLKTVKNYKYKTLLLLRNNFKSNGTALLLCFSILAK